jgi:hypothetical protein
MKTEVIDAILELETLGYSFKLEGNAISYTHNGTGPDSAVVYPLMSMIKKNRQDAIEWLRDDADAFRMDCLINAADRAKAEARKAEFEGKLHLAHSHWRRFARFFATAASMAGATEPFIPWDEWVSSFDDEIVLSYDPEPELQLQG